MEKKEMDDFTAATEGAISVQLEAFMKGAPGAWFSLIESNFVVRGITDPKTKYHHAVTKLPPEICKKLQEMLRIPVDGESYDRLQRKLCKLFEPSATE